MYYTQKAVQETSCTLHFQDSASDIRDSGLMGRQYSPLFLPFPQKVYSNSSLPRPWKNDSQISREWKFGEEIFKKMSFQAVFGTYGQRFLVLKILWTYLLNAVCKHPCNEARNRISVFQSTPSLHRAVPLWWGWRLLIYSLGFKLRVSNVGSPA